MDDTTVVSLKDDPLTECAREEESANRIMKKKRKQVRYGTDIVIKNNNLVTAIRQPGSNMGVAEYKTLLAIIAHVPRDIDIDVLPVGQSVVLDIPRENIAKACRNSNLFGKKLDDILDTIHADRVRVKYPDGKVRLTAWAGVIEYFPDRGDIHVEIDREMVQFLIADTVLGFTRFAMPEIAGMRSLRSILLYEHVAMNEYVGVWEPTIEDLRVILDAPIKSYPTTGALYKYIVLQAVNEINSTPDTRLVVKTVEYIKKMRKAVAVRFEISPKSHDHPVAIPRELLLSIPPRLRKDQRFLGTIKYEMAFNKSGKSYTSDQLRRVVLYALENAEDKDDMAAWLRYCLDAGQGKVGDYYYMQGGRSTKYNGPSNEIKVTWTNVPDEQNQEMWTSKDGTLDIGSMILPKEKVQELLRTDQLVRVYL